MLINKLFNVNYICLYLRGEGTHDASSQCSPADCYSINILIMETAAWQTGTKKRRGAKFLSIAYPYYQAFALPPLKDKQRKPAHVERQYKPTTPQPFPYINTKNSTCMELHLIIYIGIEDVGNKNSPTWTFLLHHRCKWNQSCEVW